ncbi:peptidase m50 : Peptidase M50 OS=Planctomyces brasiliensis (strain ATCC 49424 / DSM 5305 / JCM 21570 / NBRC 103401 / IFAM 1448) GN=Plabr_4470 PE=4 SV=1: Peptidase_M50 [Gemmata massiliana]|uniref:Peptidase M50 domain-containing protein n=1 Tax=Gemmata massiliana TaxID=1210884 RepID=A0A6P2DKX8_9BACT|nr:site-2 protease family protein [Gemmata massiliana]VTS03121.1 peptidase m50 : Peptidase M50 OS=Planctomyces brasiliensis (strain ATCC 49424 / DSM 5305 / JCM 21570 / NBRC 103401 / IFAM 1448) GN=Plabr_4470 PE=4 SV=1: Peptidase_M50 [Gemmata massiliana]
MDPNPNAGSSVPVNPPGAPAPGGEPDHSGEVSAVKSWVRENAFSLVTTAVVIALVCAYLDPIDTLKVVLGLGFIIFIHELGHFLAAKWCDVHVNMFSIGFGPAVPFCQYKWGETTYKIGIIPLGGFVQMVGEGDGGDNEEAEDDPRSFRKKTVGQRMLIISAGVVMNIILGMACFVAAYLHGVQEKPGTINTVESGGAAWRAGMRTDDHITEIGGRKKPFFDDIRPIVMSTQKDEQVPIEWERNGVASGAKSVSPLREEGQRFPQLGVSPPYNLVLMTGPKRSTFTPLTAGSPAAATDPKFLPGDRVVAMSDPANPATITPVATYSDYHRRMVLLAGKDVTFHVARVGAGSETQPTAITVKPSYRYDLGMRMRMGEISALRVSGSAEKVGVIAHTEGAQPKRGDRIKAVMLPPDEKGKRVWYVNGLDWKKKEFETPDQKAVDVRPLDPLLLPHQLNQWAAGKAGPLSVELVLSREAHPTDEQVRLKLDFDPSFRFDRETQVLPNSPLPISGLGLAYWVEPVVDDVASDGPAAKAKTTPGELPDGWYYRIRRSLGLDPRDVEPGGEEKALRPNDTIVGVRFKGQGADGKPLPGEWKDELQAHPWAAVDFTYQSLPPFEIDLKVKRSETETFTVTLQGRPNTEFPTSERGLVFQSENQIQKAADVGDAIELGARRTGRFIKVVYMNLYAMAFGRVSVKTMSGPLTIATVSYRFAGEDFWQFLLFLGMISVNLAVVNFLPIPVLDGGHMVFLILEKILGRPVPERMFAIAMYTGLFLILSLMVFVIFLDVGRLFFGKF